MLIAWSFTSLPTLPSVIASRPNSLARTTSVRSSRPRSSRSRISCATGASISFFIVLGALVAVLVRVPVDERDVLGRDLDVARAGLDQPPRQQAAQAEAAGVVGVEAVLRLERQVERLGRRRAQQAVGGVERADQRLALVVAAVLVDRLLREQLLEQLRGGCGSARRRAPSAAAPPRPRPADRRSGTGRTRCRGSRRCGTP